MRPASLRTFANRATRELNYGAKLMSFLPFPHSSSKSSMSLRRSAYSGAFLRAKLREPVGALPLSADCRTGIGVIR